MSASQKKRRCADHELRKRDDDVIVHRTESTHDVEDDQRREKPGYEKKARLSRCFDSHGAVETRDSYEVNRLTANTPATASSTSRMPRPNESSVGPPAAPSPGGAGGGTRITPPLLHPPMVLPPAPGIVTAALIPTALPSRLLVDETVTLWSAMTVPKKVFPLSVAEVPTRQ